MTLKKAVSLAKKNKCMIKNGDLRMFNQDAKSILFWLLETKTKETSIELYKLYVNSSEWELEFREKKWS